MTHRGVEYTLVLSSNPSIWKWRFQIGDKVKIGWKRGSTSWQSAGSSSELIASSKPSRAEGPLHRLIQVASLIGR